MLCGPRPSGKPEQTGDQATQSVQAAIRGADAQSAPHSSLRARRRAGWREHIAKSSIFKKRRASFTYPNNHFPQLSYHHSTRKTIASLHYYDGNLRISPFPFRSRIERIITICYMEYSTLLFPCQEIGPQ